MSDIQIDELGALIQQNEELQAQLDLYKIKNQNLEMQIDELEEGLNSISNNSCCEPCREAALVACKTLCGCMNKQQVCNKCQSIAFGLSKEDKVTDISEYREPHSVINTGKTVHVMPTEVVNQIKAEGVREYGKHVHEKDLYALSPEAYADKLEKGDV